MRPWIIRPAAALALLLVLAGPALAWTEFRLSGLKPGQRYTLRITDGGAFGFWKQNDPRSMMIQPRELSFTATGREAILDAVLYVKSDSVVGTITPWEGVSGTVNARGYGGVIEDGVWFISYPGAPTTCTASPNCPTEFCPPGQKCYAWQGGFYCCWLPPDSPH
ncbi:MAG: hypothetical protein K9K66_19370 [Desulfarculaceae bacterium]|nr:hypothetical protein [Desulfarculaceae bacterium]MCF8074381.1 hypothetical protein [Desulfarculaceae bacterium]MCF8103816.1 hypothetical protein [Desulfarculaceae bacterium]MCF8118155.1 hypothetical protein [Desulfarculaceae bacterium]